MINYYCLSFGSCQTIFTDVLGMKSAVAHGHRSGDADYVQQRSRFAHKELKPKPNHPYGNIQKSQDRKKHVKFGQMWRFCSLFSSITTAWCTRNSSHKVVRSILSWSYAPMAQIIKNPQNYGKTNHGFCTKITYRLTRWCLCVSFCSKTKP